MGRAIDNIRHEVRGFRALWAGDLALAWVDVKTHRFANVNGTFAKLLNRQPSELIGEPSSTIFHDSDAVAWKETLEFIAERTQHEISRVSVKVLPKGAKEYSVAFMWGKAIYDRTEYDAPPSSILIHMWRVDSNYSCSTGVTEMEVMMRLRQLEKAVENMNANPKHDNIINVSRDHDEIGGNKGNTSANSADVIKWLIVGLVAIAISSIWWRYYDHGGQHVPPGMPHLEAK